MMMKCDNKKFVKSLRNAVNDYDAGKFGLELNHSSGNNLIKMIVSQYDAQLITKIQQISSNLKQIECSNNGNKDEVHLIPEIDMDSYVNTTSSEFSERFAYLILRNMLGTQQIYIYNVFKGDKEKSEEYVIKCFEELIFRKIKKKEVQTFDFKMSLLKSYLMGHYKTNINIYSRCNSIRGCVNTCLDNKTSPTLVTDDVVIYEILKSAFMLSSNINPKNINCIKMVKDITFKDVDSNYILDLGSNILEYGTNILFDMFILCKPMCMLKNVHKDENLYTGIIAIEFLKFIISDTHFNNIANNLIKNSI